MKSKTLTLFILIALTAWRAHAADAAAESGLGAVEQLGSVNGQALACGEKAAASRAKSLMLLHAPKTARYGDAFEQATQQGFLGQVKGQSVCPDAPALAERIDVIAKRLQEALPATPR